MVVTKKFNPFDDGLLDQHPELKHILKFRPGKVPFGSMNTKVIINDDEIIERVCKTPKGQVVSLFSKSSNRLFDYAA